MADAHNQRVLRFFGWTEGQVLSVLAGNVDGAARLEEDHPRLSPEEQRLINYLAEYKQRTAQRDGKCRQQDVEEGTQEEAENETAVDRTGDGKDGAAKEQPGNRTGVAEEQPGNGTGVAEEQPGNGTEGVAEEQPGNGADIIAQEQTRDATIDRAGEKVGTYVEAIDIILVKVVCLKENNRPLTWGFKPGLRSRSRSQSRSRPESVVLTGVGVGVGVGKFSSTPTPARSRSRL